MTSDVRSAPTIDGLDRTSDNSSSTGRLAAGPLKMPTRIAPASRRCRVNARVSIPAIPTTPYVRRSSSKVRCARQFDTIRDGSRTTYPDTQMRSDSGSSSFMPVLPTCGAVITTT